MGREVDVGAAPPVTGFGGGYVLEASGEIVVGSAKICVALKNQDLHLSLPPLYMSELEAALLRSIINGPSLVEVAGEYAPDCTAVEGTLYQINRLPRPLDGCFIRTGRFNTCTDIVTPLEPISVPKSRRVSRGSLQICQSRVRDEAGVYRFGGCHDLF